MTATISIWIEDESEDIVQERLERLLDAVNASEVPCSVSEEMHYEAA